MLLVDANVVAYLLIEGDKTEAARALWSMDNDWQAPRLLFYELASVFVQYVRQGAISLEEAIAGLEGAAGIVQPHDQDPPPGRVLEISSKLAVSAYDATYLATAEALGAPLVTADRRLLRAAPGITRSLDPASGDIPHIPEPRRPSP